MALKDDIEASVRAAEGEMRADPEGWTGGDWWQLLPQEEDVFGIERERWPRMMLAWFFFEVFHKLVDVGEEEAPVRLLHEEKERRPDIEYSHEGFDRFAVDYVDLTLREADAAHGKMHFTNVRHGVVQYTDEDGAAEQPIAAEPV